MNFKLEFSKFKNQRENSARVVLFLKYSKILMKSKTGP
ncbi:hypothetical protein LEP1GSC052_1033 [Leptospira kmetyi serovar Malaysia str. Bejo-Iso9]|nr:hypothetical protein LEP1GSC052_1033 [Leptospira kmetyi serovar Malaysia str. Bejo-Iso9]